MVSCGCVRIGLVTSLLLFASVPFSPFLPLLNGMSLPRQE